MTNTTQNDDQDAGPPGNGITSPISGRDPQPAEEPTPGKSDDEHADDPVTGVGPEDPS